MGQNYSFYRYFVFEKLCKWSLTELMLNVSVADASAHHIQQLMIIFVLFLNYFFAG